MALLHHLPSNWITLLSTPFVFPSSVYLHLHIVLTILLLLAIILLETLEDFEIWLDSDFKIWLDGDFKIWLDVDFKIGIEGRHYFGRKIVSTESEKK